MIEENNTKEVTINFEILEIVENDLSKKLTVDERKNIESVLEEIRNKAEKVCVNHLLTPNKKYTVYLKTDRPFIILSNGDKYLVEINGIELGLDMDYDTITIMEMKGKYKATRSVLPNKMVDVNIYKYGEILNK